MKLIQFLLLTSAAYAQLRPGNVDFSGATTTKIVKSGTAPPGTCATGELFNDTDATAGQNLLLCTSTNTWTAVGAAATGALASAVVGKTGSTYLPSDAGVLLRDNGAAFVPWGPIFPLKFPPAASGLTWTNQGTATATDSNGGLLMKAPASASDNVRVLTKAAPATPWTLTVGLFVQGFPSTASAGGIVLRESSTGKLITFELGHAAPAGISNPFIAVQRWTNATTFNTSIQGAIPYDAWGFIFLRVKDDGTNLEFSYSRHGFDFDPIFATQSRTAHMAGGPNQAGLFLNNTNSKINSLLCFFWDGI